MKKLQLLYIIASTIFFALSSQAQQSCSFIIHVDGLSGIDSTTCGEENAPCATINFGIDRAVTENYSDVRIAANTNYLEVIELTDGVNIWGGFDAQWAVTGLTVITGGVAGNGEFYTVRADAINSPTVLSDLEIIAPNATTPGKSSYGVHVTNSTGLMLQRVTIQGGTGSNGTPGDNGTDATIAGVNGSAGGNADEFNTSCNDDDSGDGGSGAVTPGNPNTTGGNGGRGGFMDDDCSGFPDYDATGGVSGQNATVYLTSSYGYRGDGGSPCNPGIDGNDGETIHGIGGTGATSSANVVGMFWEALLGLNGTLGENGTGGGGGGGSGGCDDGTDSYGAGGGGGGSGGIAAPTFGAGGLSGGNSAAVFMLASTCSFIDCNFFLGIGGNGAAGGIGGNGTNGGIGGSGGNSAGDSDAGGNGGDGGNGGSSGAGGGGASGSSFGIYANNSTINRTGSTFDSGSSGAFGLGGSGTVAGTDGSTGIVENVGGSATDNVGILTLEEDPCTEIVTFDLATLTLCAGETTTVGFNAVGSFTGSNTFTAQLSDPNGDFSSPIIIGSIVSNTSGTVMIEIPGNAIGGTGYRIRIVSSATPAIGIENITDIVISALPNVVANASTLNVCAGNEVTLTGSGADLYTWNNGTADGVAFSPTETLYYTVIGVDGITFCGNVDSILVTVTDLPDTSVIQNGNQLAAVLSGATYQWVDCNNGNSIIQGEEGQTYIASNPGNYAVVVTQNNCSDTSSCHNVMTVDLEELSVSENVILLYPNPSTGLFQFISDAKQSVSVSVYNAMGQVVLQKQDVTNNSSIDLTDVTNGLYSIQFYNDELNLLRQVIVQR